MILDLSLVYTFLGLCHSIARISSPFRLVFDNSFLLPQLYTRASKCVFVLRNDICNLDLPLFYLCLPPFSFSFSTSLISSLLSLPPYLPPLSFFFLPPSPSLSSGIPAIPEGYISAWTSADGLPLCRLSSHRGEQTHNQVTIPNKTLPKKRVEIKVG